MDMKDSEQSADGAFPLVELPDASWEDILGRALTEPPVIEDDSLVPFSDDEPLSADDETEGLVLETDDDADDADDPDDPDADHVDDPHHADHVDGADDADHVDAGEGLSFDSDPFGPSDGFDDFDADGLSGTEGVDGGDDFGSGNDFSGDTDQNDIGF